MAFAAIGIDLRWRGQGIDEEGICKKTGKMRVKVNPGILSSCRSRRTSCGTPRGRKNCLAGERKPLWRVMPANGRGRHPEERSWVLVLNEC